MTGTTETDRMLHIRASRCVVSGSGEHDWGPFAKAGIMQCGKCGAEAPIPSTPDPKTELFDLLERLSSETDVTAFTYDGRVIASDSEMRALIAALREYGRLQSTLPAQSAPAGVASCAGIGGNGQVLSPSTAPPPAYIGDAPSTPEDEDETGEALVFTDVGPSAPADFDDGGALTTEDPVYTVLGDDPIDAATREVIEIATRTDKRLWGREMRVRDVLRQLVAPSTPTRPHGLAWNGTEWVAPCGCRYHPDDDNGTHGGAPHVHRCERHTSAPMRDDVHLALAESVAMEELESMFEDNAWAKERLACIRSALRRAPESPSAPATSPGVARALAVIDEADKFDRPVKAWLKAIREALSAPGRVDEDGVRDMHARNVQALLDEGCICGDYAAITGSLHPDCPKHRAPEAPASWTVRPGPVRGTTVALRDGEVVATYWHDEGSFCTPRAVKIPIAVMREIFAVDTEDDLYWSLIGECEGWRVWIEGIVREHDPSFVWPATGRPYEAQPYFARLTKSVETMVSGNPALTDDERAMLERVLGDFGRGDISAQDFATSIASRHGATMLKLMQAAVR